MAGTLYIVATPIGNLRDITLRALDVLRSVDLIAAEDTRVTRKLLSHYQIHKPLLSLHAHSTQERITDILGHLQGGTDVAMVADAGTPLLSDPGAEVTAAAVAAGIRVVPIPGPSAITAALAACALPVARFAFDGFPPRRKGDRRTFFQRLQAEHRAVVLFEAPGRLVETLQDLNHTLGDRSVAVARELTKLHEEIFRGTLSAAVAHFATEPVRGECTIIVAPPEQAASPAPCEAAIRNQVAQHLAAGTTLRTAVETVSAELGIAKKQVYAAALAAKRAANGARASDNKGGAPGTPEFNTDAFRDTTSKGRSDL